MTFNASNPLSHIGVRAQRPAEQYIKQNRDPTPDDYQNFVIGDEWRNNVTNIWWKLCDIFQNQALWEKLAGPGTQLETITAGDGVIVIPDSNSNINFIDGNGVNSTGAGSDITFNMNPPYTGDFIFQGTTSGVTETVAVIHTVNTVDSNARFIVQVAGIAGQDAWVQTGADSGPSYAMGIDTSTANEPWKLTYDSGGKPNPSTPPIGAIWDPILSLMTFPEQVNANSYGLPNLPSAGYGKVIANAYKTVSADGTLTIVKGSKISGIGMLSFEGPSRNQKVVFAISGAFGDTSVCFSEISNNALGSNTVFTDFVISSDGISNIALECTIGNRNAGTDVILTWYDDSAAPINVTNIDLLPSSYTAVSYLFSGGFTMSPAVSNPNAYIRDNITNNFNQAFSIEHALIPGSTAANNIGVSMDFSHAMPSGSAIGARLATQCPNASTNDQTTDFFIQTNYLGSLVETVKTLWDASEAIYGTAQILRVENRTTSQSAIIQVNAEKADAIAAILELRATNNGIACPFVEWIVETQITWVMGLDQTNADLMTLGTFGAPTRPDICTKAMTITSLGVVHANQFLTPVGAIGASSDAFFYAQTAGGASNGYLEIDLANSSGFGGIRMLNVGGAAQQWEIHAHGSENSINLEYNNSIIFGVTANRILEFFGTASNPAPNITAQAQVTTVDATVTTIYSIAIATSQTVELFARISGKKSDFSASLWGTVNVGARRAGGAAALVSLPIVNFGEDSASAPTISATVSGNNLIVQVQGVAAETWNWLVTIEYTVFV